MKEKSWRSVHNNIKPVFEHLDLKEFWVWKFTAPSLATHILAFKAYSTELNKQEVLSKILF